MLHLIKASNMIRYVIKGRHIYLSIFLICVCLLYNSFRDECSWATNKKNVLPINIAGIELEVELATTFDEHALGLMYRDTLGKNSGMLFIFPKEKFLSFWMKDTRIPLSIAFIKEDGRIIEIKSMKPYSLDTHVSKEKAKYALEMNEGWFKAHNVKEGDTVKIPLPRVKKYPD